MQSTGKVLRSVAFILAAIFAGSREGEKPQNEKRISRHLSSLICHHLMSTLSALLPLARVKSDIIVGKHACIVCMSSLWLPDLQSWQHCQEQWIGVTH